MFIFSAGKVPKRTNHCFHLCVTKRTIRVNIRFKLLYIIPHFWGGGVVFFPATTTVGATHGSGCCLQRFEDLASTWLPSLLSTSPRSGCHPAHCQAPLSLQPRHCNLGKWRLVAGWHRAIFGSHGLRKHQTCPSCYDSGCVELWRPETRRVWGDQSQHKTFATWLGLSNQTVLWCHVYLCHHIAQSKMQSVRKYSIRHSKVLAYTVKNKTNKQKKSSRGT